MPPFFSSRRRGSSASRTSNHIPLDRATTQNAAAAASQAFLGRPPSSGSLSSAAAAAALRSHTTSPEPVGSIQTKRMVRRGSQSSIGSGSIMVNGRPGMQRRGSQSSMTKRSFRSPSPGRERNGDGPVPQARDAPPVPAIPRSLSQEHKRSSSVEPQKRVTSPTPAGRGNGRAMSMDSRNGMQPPPSNRKAKRLSNVNEEAERAETAGRSSVNFSRPISPTSPTGSPTTDKPYTHGTGAWFSEPAVSLNGPQLTSKEAALDSKIARIQAAAGQPVKKSYEDSSAQGTYLNRANYQPPQRPASVASQRPASVASVEPAPISYETSDAVMVYDPNSRTFVTKPRIKPKAPEPAAPVLPQPKALPPGAYDPNTRTIVPAAASATQSRPGTAGSLQGERPARLGLDTDLQPPPRNPARLSPVDSPSAANLKKQPSVVREEPELEDSAAGFNLAGTARNKQASGPPKSYFVPSGTKQRSSSLDIPRGALDRSARGRGNSASPSPARSAHFSPSPVIQATRHDPPPRDISPAKSALKHSPASSIRTTSPLAHFTPGPRSPVTDISDTTSQASEDAFTGRKKKSVRVSFDEQPYEIEAANAVSTPKAIARERSPAVDDVDDEELMKPRPALPSFGSIRKQRASSPEVAEKVTEMAPERHEASSDHAIGGILRNATSSKTSGEPVPPEVVSKESAGYVSDESDELGAPTAASTPAKPAVSSSLDSSPQETKVKDFAAVPKSGKIEDGDVPAINLLPPTPGVEDEHRTLSSVPSSSQRDSRDIEVPGSWAKEDENQAEVASAGAAAATAAAVEAKDQAPVVPEDPVVYQSPDLLAAIDEDTDTDEFSDAAEDPSEFDNGGFASLDAIAVSPVINPSVTDQSTVGTASPPETPVKQTSKKAETLEKGHASKGSSDWTEATAYWSQLSKERREQIEREHLSSDDEGRPAPAVRKAKKKTALKQADTLAPTSVATPAAAPTMRKSMRAQPEPTPAPGPADNEVHMRKSMRSGGAGGGMASTLRNGPPASKQQPAATPKGPMQNRSMRPVSQQSNASLPSSVPSTEAHSRQGSDSRPLPLTSAYPPIQSKPKPAQPKVRAAPVMTAKLQKDLSHDSDSESSFKKKRRATKVDSQGRYSMKRSMRGGPVERETPMREQRPVSPTPPRGKGKDSFSIRSLSPSGSLFGRKKQVENVRQSIRGSSVDAGSRMSMRNRPDSRSSARPASSQTTSRFKSRFNDSDDEREDDGPRRNFFKSRFADSDDEDDDVFIPADLTPVRGIPRKQGQYDGDSTDLEDEDEDDARKSHRNRTKLATPMVPDSADIDKAMEAARKKLGIAENPSQPTTNGNQGSSLAQGSLRNSEAEPKSRPEDLDITGKKKRGFMGSILRRNRNSTQSVATLSSPTFAPSEVPQSPVVNTASPAAATASPSSPMAVRPQSPTSPSGGNKLVRRSSAQQAPRMRRGNSNYSNVTAPPDVSESHLRNSDWPLPAVPSIPDKYTKERPNTSDGGRSYSADKVRFQDVDGDGVDGPKYNVYSQRTGKKKRFGKLRRAFGLND